MDLGLAYALDCLSNTSSVKLLRNEQLKCSIEQVHALTMGSKIINDDGQRPFSFGNARLALRTKKNNIEIQETNS